MKWTRSYTFITLALIVAGVFLRLFYINHQSLWWDEGASLYFSGGSSLDHCFTRLQLQNTSERFQPLFFFVLYFWRQVFGDTSARLRFLPALFGTGVLIVLPYAVSRVYGKKQGLLALLAVALSSYNIFYSQELRPYSMLLFLTSLQLLAFTHIMKPGRARPAQVLWLLLFWISSAVGIYSSIFVCIFSFALALGHLIYYRRMRTWVLWWVPVAVLSLPILLYYVTKPADSERTSTGVSQLHQPVIENTAFVAYGVLAGQTLGPPPEDLRGTNKIEVVLSYWPEVSTVLAIGIAYFVFFAVLLSQPRAPDDETRSATALFVLVLVVSMLMSLIFTLGTKLNWQPRHSFFLWVPLAALLPVAFGDIKSNKRLRKAALVAQIAFVAVLVVNAKSLANYYFNPAYSRDDYRGASQFLERHKDVPSIMLRGMPGLLSYYGYPYAIDGTLLKPDDLPDEVELQTDSAKHIFVVVNREWDWGPPGAVENALAERYRLLSTKRLCDFNIYSYAKKGAAVESGSGEKPAATLGRQP